MFQVAVTRALNPTENHPERITKTLRKHTEELNWDGLEFPAKLPDIRKFEKNNDVGVNVFSADESFKVYPLRLTKLRTESSCVNLFLWNNYYSVVKDLSRLVSAQVSGKEHKKHICVHCLNAVFGTSELLQQHMELCLNNDHQRHEYPEPGSISKFENYERTQTVPFVIYADFECYIEGLDTVEQNPHKLRTTQYQKHNPSGFCYYIKCFDNSIYKPKLVHYTQQYEGEDITKKFVDLLEEETRDTSTRSSRL